MPSFKSCSPSVHNMQTHQSTHSTTSVNTMPFSQDFEAQVNRNMTPETSSSSQDHKGKRPASFMEPEQATDEEWSEKMGMKDQSQHQLPPRFSTIFDTKVPASFDAKVPTTPTRAFESYPQQPTRKSGVYIAKPLLWAFLVIFLFETAVLFAYTVIGLLNNINPKLIHTNSAGAVVAGCDCNVQPVNISPNFFMPQGQQAPVIETTTSTTSATSTSTTSSSTSQVAGVNASQLAEIIADLRSAQSTTRKPTTHVTTVTPPGPTVKSTTVLTVDPSGSTIEPRPTVTSTKIVGSEEASPTLSTRDESAVAVSTSAPGLAITPVTCLNANTDELCVTVPSSPTSTPPSTMACLNENTDELCITVPLSPTATPKSCIKVGEGDFCLEDSSAAGAPIMSLTLKTRDELANKPTQEPK